MPDDVGKGAVVALRFGGAAARGVVIEAGVEAPPGVEAAPVGRVRRRAATVLVDLALWLAAYYGTTPGRALELVAPLRRRPRGERPSLAADGKSLAGEAEPDELTSDQVLQWPASSLSLDGGGGHVLLAGPTGSGKTEVYLQAARWRSSADAA